MAYALKNAADRTLNERAAVLQMKINAGADDGCREEHFAILGELSRRAIKALRGELRAAAAVVSAELAAMLAIVGPGQPVPVYHLNPEAAA